MDTVLNVLNIREEDIVEAITEAVDWFEEKTNWIPEVAPPKKKVSFSEKLKWTFLPVFLLLCMQQVPLYGYMSNGPRRNQLLGEITGSMPGTLMEVGFAPTMYAGMILMLVFQMAGNYLNKVNKITPQLIKKVKKVFTFVMIVCCVGMTVLGGSCGSLATLGIVNIILLLAQLLFATTLTVFLDEVVQMYGFGSCSSLFVTINTCKRIFSCLFSMNNIETFGGSSLRGIVPALFSAANEMLESGNLEALKELIWRGYAPNLTHLLAFIVIFSALVYINNMGVNVPIKSRKTEGVEMSHRIKLLQGSTSHMIEVNMLNELLEKVSWVLTFILGANLFTNFLGAWQGDTVVGGLLYYSSSFAGTVLACTWLSYKNSSSTRQELSNNLERSNLVLAGSDTKNNTATIKRWMSVSAVFSGLSVGVLTCIEILLRKFKISAFCSLTSMLMAINSLPDLISEVQQEYVASGSKIFGWCSKYVSIVKLKKFLGFKDY